MDLEVAEVRTILVDGDGVAYRSAWAGNSERSAVRFIENLAANLSADRVICAFGCSGAKTFRHELFEAYKPSRKERPPEVNEAEVAIWNNFVCRKSAGLEADDLVGIMATNPKREGEWLICANDKDMFTIPGLHHNWKDHVAGETRTVDATEAYKNHLLQTMAGDSSDGYKGATGIGPKKAAKALGLDPKLWWQETVEVFRGCGQTEDDALLQARLAYLLQFDDFDIETRKPRLWTPERSQFMS